MLKLQDKDLMMSRQICLQSFLFFALKQDKANTWQLKMRDLSKLKYTLLP